MSHKCTYFDEGYCLNVYGETCPYNGTDEQCKCLEYEPKENYIAAFTNEVMEDYKNQIKDLQNKLGEVLLQVNVSKEMTLQEAKRKGAEEFAEKLKEKLHNDYVMPSGETDERLVFECVDEALGEYKND